MKLDNATVLITGANRGLGVAFAGMSGNPAVHLKALGA